jgi:sarcosine oxidase, subunit gamma
MTSLQRISAINDALSELPCQWETVNGMPVPMSIGDPAAESEALRTVALADLSCLTRFGLKGPAAEVWLGSREIPLPQRMNQWLPIGRWGLLARLGSSEFLIEDDPGERGVTLDLKAELGRGIRGVVPVLRQDAEIAIAGCRAIDLLVQTCNVNFLKLPSAERPVVMTSMIGVSVLIVPSTWDEVPLYRVWCDPSYAQYLWTQLLGIVKELGGGVIGLAAIFGKPVGSKNC